MLSYDLLSVSSHYLIRMSVILDEVWLYLTWYLQGRFFQIRLYSEVLGVTISTSLLGDTIQPTTVLYTQFVATYFNFIIACILRMNHLCFPYIYLINCIWKTMPLFQYLFLILFFYLISLTSTLSYSQQVFIFKTFASLFLKFEFDYYWNETFKKTIHLAFSFLICVSMLCLFLKLGVCFFFTNLRELFVH